jgi:hypothetical protein
MMRVTLLHFAFTPQRVSPVTGRFYVPSARMWTIVALWKWGGNSGFQTDNSSY